MYNMSDAISQGNARTSQIDDLNEQIRANNATKIQNAKDAIKENVSTDKEMGLLAGIKDAVGEGGALANVQGKVKDYQKAVAKLGEGGKLEAYLADEKNQIFTAILALYAGENETEIFKDLNELHKKHPREVEFYIPQLCTYLFHFNKVRIDKEKSDDVRPSDAG